MDLIQIDAVGPEMLLVERVRQRDRTQRSPQPSILHFLDIRGAIQVLQDSPIVAPASLIVATAMSYDKPGYASPGINCSD